MRMKMFIAETFEAAKALIHTEFGDDAIILSERVVDDGVEVRAAIDRAQSTKVATPVFNRKLDAYERPSSEPLRNRLRETLRWHGMPDALVDMISGAGAKLNSGDIEFAHALATGLEGIIACSPIPPMPERDLILIGPPGGGRTTTAAKLTRRAAVANHAVTPLAADFDATAGGAQLSAYLELEQHLVTAVQDPDGLFDALTRLRAEGRRTVIDLPAINPFDREDLARLRDLVAAIAAEPVLVMSAEGHPDDLAEIAYSFAQCGVRRAIVTKLDAVRRRGGAFAAISQARLSLSHLATTPFIGGGLVPAATGRIAALLTDDVQGANALKGAA